MSSPKSDLPQRTLDLLILKNIALGPVHGYAVAQRLQQISGDVVQVPGGSQIWQRLSSAVGLNSACRKEVPREPVGSSLLFVR